MFGILKVYRIRVKVWNIKGLQNQSQSLEYQRFIESESMFGILKVYRIRVNVWNIKGLQN